MAPALCLLIVDILLLPFGLHHVSSILFWTRCAEAAKQKKQQNENVQHVQGMGKDIWELLRMDGRERMVPSLVRG